MCRDAGISAEKLIVLERFEDDHQFTDEERLVLRYAAAVTKTPVQVSNELFAELSAQFDARQLVELTSSIAWENFRARFEHALGMKSEGFFTEAVCTVPHNAA